MTQKNTLGYPQIVLIILSLVMTLSANKVIGQKITEDLYEAGYEAYDNGDYPSAIDYCGRAIKRKPDFADAYWLRASAYFNYNQVGPAIDDYTKTISLLKDTDKDLSEVYVNRGFAYMTINNVDKAIADYTTAIDLNPNNSQAIWDRGIAYQELGIFDTAISDYSVAAQYYQKDRYSLSVIYTNRAQCFVNLKRFDQAIADCNSAILLNPDNGSSFWIKGIVYEQIYQPDKAIKELEHALTFYENDEPDLSKLYWKIGFDYYLIKNYKKALTRYDRAIMYNSKYEQAYYTRGLLLLNKLNKEKKAKHDFDKLANPGKETNYYTVVGKYFLGDKNVVLSYLKNFPDSFTTASQMNSAYFDAACLYSLMAEEQNAIIYLEKALYSGYNDYYNVKTEVALEPIRQTPAYQDLIKKYGVN